MSDNLKDDMGADDMDVGDDSDVGSGAALDEALNQPSVTTNEWAMDEESIDADTVGAEPAAQQQSTRLPFISTAASVSPAAEARLGPPPAWSAPVWKQPESQQQSTLRDTFRQLPQVNRWCLGSGSALVALALVLTVGPPLAAALQSAAHPYTAAGKQETCATRLHSIALALTAYAQDHEGRFPPLDYQDARQQRVTWVSLMRDRPEAMAKDASLECPAGPRLPRGQEHLLSSYVLNPVLATAKTTEMDDAAATLMLVDGGLKHDVSMLPPYPT